MKNLFIIAISFFAVFSGRAQAQIIAQSGVLGYPNYVKTTEVISANSQLMVVKCGKSLGTYYEIHDLATMKRAFSISKETGFISKEAKRFYAPAPVLMHDTVCQFATYYDKAGKGLVVIGMQYAKDGTVIMPEKEIYVLPCDKNDAYLLVEKVNNTITLELANNTLVDQYEYTYLNLSSKFEVLNSLLVAGSLRQMMQDGEVLLERFTPKGKNLVVYRPEKQRKKKKQAEIIYIGADDKIEKRFNLLDPGVVSGSLNFVHNESGNYLAGLYCNADKDSYAGFFIYRFDANLENPELVISSPFSQDEKKNKMQVGNMIDLIPDPQTGMLYVYLRELSLHISRNKNGEENSRYYREGNIAVHAVSPAGKVNYSYYIEKADQIVESERDYATSAMVYDGKFYLVSTSKADKVKNLPPVVNVEKGNSEINECPIVFAFGEKGPESATRIENLDLNKNYTSYVNRSTATQGFIIMSDYENTQHVFGDSQLANYILYKPH